MNSKTTTTTAGPEKQKKVTAPQQTLIKKLDYEIKLIDNMQKRVNTYTTRLSYCSYVDRILLRLRYARDAFKDLRNRLVYYPEESSGDNYHNGKEDYSTGRGREKS